MTLQCPAAQANNHVSLTHTEKRTLKMAFYRFLLTYCKWTLVFSVIIGLVSGFGLTGVMAVIHRVLNNSPEVYIGYLLAFSLLWLVYGSACILSEILLIHLSEKIAFRLKLALTGQIFKKKIRDLEEIGEHRLFAVLVEDIWTITNLVGRLPNAFVNTATVLGCYGYMFWLSPALFLFNLSFLLTGIILYQIPANIAKQYLATAREASDEAVGQFRHLTQGIKELFIHFPKRQEFLDLHLNASNRKLMEQNISAKSIYAISQRFGELLVLVNIGVLLFLVPRFYKVDAHLLTGFILASLFSLSPLTTLLSFIPEWIKAGVALEKVQSYGFDLFDINPVEDAGPRPFKGPSVFPSLLTLQEIKFEYKDKLNGDRFIVGPVSFEMKSGEVTFLVGGNGTGKTTLAKIVCGLYRPLHGRILWNDEPVDSLNREDFQQNFSVIFSDYFLFKHLIGIDPGQISAHAGHYLSSLQMEKKVSIKNRAFSTIALSNGQRKRLALLAASLEDRPVYIFDEWAAGQDPSFKKIFYEKILIDLKKKNKMVLVITHDDNYFQLADQVIKLEDGKII